jgi:hypothetical protein
MIKINLLPLDKRKTERTPLKGAGLMIADAAVAAVVAILVVISFIQIGNVNAEIEANKKTLESLQPFVQQHDALLAEVTRLTAEEADLKKVTSTRPFEWSEVFDSIWDAIHKHKRVWLDSIELVDGKQMESKFKQMDAQSPASNARYGIILKCHVAGADVKGMTAFRRELKENPVVSRYFPHLNFDVQWNKMEQKEFAEKFSLDFEIHLVNTGQTKENTSAVTAVRREP